MPRQGREERRAQPTTTETYVRAWAPRQGRGELREQPRRTETYAPASTHPQGRGELRDRPTTAPAMPTGSRTPGSTPRRRKPVPAGSPTYLPLST
ncbi:hypothetical protein AB0I27_36100 [Streptomyces sp. NPDC050597]|uniref:hypothetical protein n=1 Tax=Streptomyces sp. NPDC050597 TaxID=3157212 RepID=UPI00341F2720